jgi:hypothetical protein
MVGGLALHASKPMSGFQRMAVGIQNGIDEEPAVLARPPTGTTGLVVRPLSKNIRRQDLTPASTLHTWCAIFSATIGTPGAVDTTVFRSHYQI